MKQTIGNGLLIGLALTAGITLIIIGFLYGKAFIIFLFMPIIFMMFLPIFFFIYVIVAIKMTKFIITFYKNHWGR